jgi:hypothetical protein
MDEKHQSWMTELVKMCVLFWSAGILTMSYLGHMQKMDPTFIASLLSGTLASYGIQRATNGNGNGNDKPKT